MTPSQIGLIFPPNSPDESSALNWLKEYADQHELMLADLYLDAIFSNGNLQVVVLNRKGGTVHLLGADEDPVIYLAIGRLVGRGGPLAVTIGMAGVRYDSQGPRARAAGKALIERSSA